MMAGGAARRTRIPATVRCAALTAPRFEMAAPASSPGDGYVPVTGLPKFALSTIIANWPKVRYANLDHELPALKLRTELSPSPTYSLALFRPLSICFCVASPLQRF